jgi:hypothetical protein
MEVEIHLQDSYRRLYEKIWEQLPEEIRPKETSQMNLMLEGELVPMSYSVAEISQEVYYLLMDTMRYKVELELYAEDVVDEEFYERQMEVRKEYSSFRVCLTIYNTTEEKRMITITMKYVDMILYDKTCQSYYSLNMTEHVWLEELHRENELTIQMEEGRVPLSSEGILTCLMDTIREKHEPSLAGLRHIQEQLEAELTTLEESQ